MTALDFSRSRLEPFAHQREDTATLVERPYFFIASEMRTGKTKIVIDAAQFLYEQGVIDRVVVIAPAPVRDVWCDRTLGEIAKHAWTDIPNKVTEFHATTREWSNQVAREYLHWFVTNYEFVAAKARLRQLLAVCTQKTLLVLDESSFVKNHASARTIACVQLRKACGRVVLLNGTPIFHNPLDLFSQGNILSPDILDCRSPDGRGPFVTYFKNRYAVQSAVLTYGGKPLLDRWKKPVQTITGWVNLEDLQRRFAPYTVRRLQKDCLDLPPKLDAVVLTSKLSDETWAKYKAMKNDLVVWLKTDKTSSAKTAALKVLRLSQITSGFLGGVEDPGIDDYDPKADDVEWNPLDGLPFPADAKTIDNVLDPPKVTTVEVGREKLETLLWFLERGLAIDVNFKVVAWCRFRPELFRTIEAVTAAFPQVTIGSIQGGQRKADRLHALGLLHPDTAPPGPVFVCGVEGTGSFGLNMTASHTCITMSSGYSPGRASQRLDRVYGPGQTEPIAYYTILASGPKGQKTIDHQIEVARRAGEDVANWTAAHWIRALDDE